MPKPLIQGTKGVEILIQFPSPITDFTSLALFVQKPNGAVAQWSPVEVVGTSTLRYVTQENDLDQSGIYTPQPEGVGNPFGGPGLPDSFTVLPRFRRTP